MKYIVALAAVLNGCCYADLILFKDGQQFLFKGSEANEIIQEEQIDFFRSFIAEDDLVFDVGANIGVKTEVYLACGAGRVICFEPQIDCVQILAEKFQFDSRVAIEAFALGGKEEQREMYIHAPASGISTLSKEYTLHSRFAERGFQWNKKMIVNLTTLDRMIQKYGLPRFCKIDVENYEFEVLMGLTQSIPFLSFECNTDQLKTTLKCIERLVFLGYREFNYAIAERGYFVSPKWMSAEELINKLYSLMEMHDFSEIWGLYGDIYARHSLEPVAKYGR